MPGIAFAVINRNGYAPAYCQRNRRLAGRGEPSHRLIVPCRLWRVADLVKLPVLSGADPAAISPPPPDRTDCRPTKAF
jgi:hypothetical protein